MAVNLTGSEPIITDRTVFCQVEGSFDAMKACLASLGDVMSQHYPLAQRILSLQAAGEGFYQSALLAWSTDPDELVFGFVPTQALEMVFTEIIDGRFEYVRLKETSENAWPLVTLVEAFHD
jgi:hypothetical protein